MNVEDWYVCRYCEWSACNDGHDTPDVAGRLALSSANPGEDIWVAERLISNHPPQESTGDMHSYERKFQVYLVNNQVDYVDTMHQVRMLALGPGVAFVNEGYADVIPLDGGTEYRRRTTRRVKPEEYSMNEGTSEFIQRWKNDEQMYARVLDLAYDRLVANKEITDQDLGGEVVQSEGVPLGDLELAVIGEAVRDAMDREKMTR